MITNFFSPLSFVTVFGSGIRDPGFGISKNQDPGSRINIPDPPHCLEHGTHPSPATQMIIYEFISCWPRAGQTLTDASFIYCGSGSGGPVIICPPGSGYLILNFGSVPGSCFHIRMRKFSIYQRLKEFLDF
jgi:hypothetical protein